MESNITIENLTPLQARICEALWQLETEEQVEAFMELLPPQVQHEVVVMKLLLTWTCVDYEFDQNPNVDQAREILQQFY